MQSIAKPDSGILWKGGRRITLKKGEVATCTSLQPGQLYGIFVYNSAQHDNSADVTVVWSNSDAPATITVPGTTSDAGLASMGFISGDTTQTIAVSLPSGAGMNEVDIWLGSVSMPYDTTGLNNQSLDTDGTPQPFSKYSRYFAVPKTSWYNFSVVSTITQFIFCQFRETKADVYVVNATEQGLLNKQVTTIGKAASAKGVVNIQTVGLNTISYTLQGDGSQWVWMDADSQQDSEKATISLQSLSG